ncbi:MAG: hypothetical protein JRH20_29120 [Deltaproteobacteria bacterium]|nr:hypothetical protein [Deltaproteobacteria bacterium]
MLRLKDGRVIAPDPLDRRLIARIVLNQARDHQLLVFALVDSHLHLEVVEPFAKAMELARCIEIAVTLRLRPKVGFAPAHPKAIRDQSHLYHCFDYILRQYAHHGVNWDPFMDASSLPDLLGMRLVGHYTAQHVRRLLPRVKREKLLGYLGISALDPTDAPLDQLVNATCAAACLPTLTGKSRKQQRARTAAITAAGDKLKVNHLAALLGVHRRSVERSRQKHADLDLVAAIRLQLALRTTTTPEDAGAFSGASRLQSPPQC